VITSEVIELVVLRNALVHEDRCAVGDRIGPPAGRANEPLALDAKAAHTSRANKELVQDRTTSSCFRGHRPHHKQRGEAASPTRASLPYLASPLIDFLGCSVGLACPCHALASMETARWTPVRWWDGVSQRILWLDQEGHLLPPCLVAMVLPGGSGPPFMQSPSAVTRLRRTAAVS
jgi:hypothetical protein